MTFLNHGTPYAFQLSFGIGSGGLFRHLWNQLRSWPFSWNFDRAWRNSPVVIAITRPNRLVHQLNSELPSQEAFCVQSVLTLFCGWIPAETQTPSSTLVTVKEKSKWEFKGVSVSILTLQFYFSRNWSHDFPNIKGDRSPFISLASTVLHAVLASLSFRWSSHEASFDFHLFSTRDKAFGLQLPRYVKKAELSFVVLGNNSVSVRRWSSVVICKPRFWSRRPGLVLGAESVFNSKEKIT